MITKAEFHEWLRDARREDWNEQTTMGDIERGVENGWACQWPDCERKDFGCGTRYGCIFATAAARKK